MSLASVWPRVAELVFFSSWNVCHTCSLEKKTDQKALVIITETFNVYLMKLSHLHFGSRVHSLLPVKMDQQIIPVSNVPEEGGIKTNIMNHGKREHDDLERGRSSKDLPFTETERARTPEIAGSSPSSLVSEMVEEQKVTAIPPDIPQFQALKQSTIQTDEPENKLMRGLKETHLKRKHNTSRSGRAIKRPNKDLPFTETKRAKTPDPLRCCQNILKELLSMKHSEYAWPFYDPVNTLALGLHDYHNIIKEPMDLSTIKKKMDQREYANAEDFCADVRLMFSNCYKYNEPSLDVVSMARKLQDVFEARYSKVNRDPESRFISQQSISTGTGVQTLSTSLSFDGVRSSKKVKAIPHEVKKLSKELPSKPKKRKRERGEKDSQLKIKSSKSKPIPENSVNCGSSFRPDATTSALCDILSLSPRLTYHEKKQLKLDMYKLPRKQRKVIFTLINAIDSFQHDFYLKESDMDFDLYRYSTQRILQNVVAAYVKDNNKRANKKKLRKSTEGIKEDKSKDCGNLHGVHKEHLLHGEDKPQDGIKKKHKNHLKRKHDDLESGRPIKRPNKDLPFTETERARTPEVAGSSPSSLVSEMVEEQRVTAIPPDIPQFQALKQATIQTDEPENSLKMGLKKINLKRKHDYSRSGRAIKRPKKDLPSTETKRTRAPDPLRRCQNILKELLSMKHSEYAWPFYDPVDTLALGLHDYHNIIKEPMDLSTIKKKMDQREYANSEDFCADVRLMFFNCYKYNKPSDDVVSMARKLQDVFEARYAKVHRDPESHFISQQSISTGTGVQTLSTSLSFDGVCSSKDVSAQLDNLEKEVKAIPPELTKLSNELPPKPKKRKRDRGEKDSQLKSKSSKSKPIPEKSVNCGSSLPDATTSAKRNKPSPSSPMTYHEKEKLKLDVYILARDQIGELFKIIYSMEPSLQSSNLEELDVDFDMLQNSTLRALQSIVAATLKRANTDQATKVAASAGSLHQFANSSASAGPSHQFANPSASAGPPHWAANIAASAGPPHWAANVAASAGPPHWAANVAASAGPPHLAAYVAASAGPPHQAANSAASAGPPHQAANSSASAGPPHQFANSSASAGPPHRAANPSASAGPPHWAANVAASAGPPHWAANVAASAGPPHWAANVAASAGPPHLAAYVAASAGPPHQAANFAASAGPPHQAANSSASAGPPHQFANSSASAGPPHRAANVAASAGPPHWATNVAASAGPPHQPAYVAASAGPPHQAANVAASAGPPHQAANVAASAGPPHQAANVAASAGSPHQAA
ncbi:bromodomain-containing protein 4B-like isoform X3 [Gouania willdenowi]|uniref:bromodomain-containing protein 4B-like isoform X3 n=1 Tax=Gouania willdenowi TaxID=441366 RepID=UPI001054E5ED|nr:bromodomain-containing protein 4B-like isoform X3 [Gouania willdenowi]